MSILHILSSRCILRHKISCFVMDKHRSPIQSSLKSLLLNNHQFSTSSRQLSLDGFYYFISSSPPVITLQNVLLDFHTLSGFPWWTVILFSTLGIRSIFVFPLAVHQNQVIARLANLNAELGKMAPQLNKEVNMASKMYGWDKADASKVYKKTMRDYYKKFIVRDNCHPFKIFLLALFQIPIWICLSVSLRNISVFPWLTQYDSNELQQQLKSEGTLWFTDLTVPDTFVIPILLAFVNLALIEIHALRKVGESTKFQKILLYAMRFIAVSVSGVAAFNPSSVSFYWLCSSTFGLVQSIMLMSPRFRLLLRIPRTANESFTPFKDIASNFRKRFSP